MANSTHTTTGSLTRKGKQTHQAIMDAGITLIRTKGFAETTVQDICAKAGIGIGTFYHYFQSKVELLLAFIGEENRELIDFYAQTDKSSYADAIMAVMGHYLDLYYLKGPDLVAQIYSTILFSEVEVVENLRFHSFYCILQDALEKGQASGEFTGQIPAETLTNTFVGTWFFFTSMWCNSKKEYDIRAIVNENFSRLIQLITPKAAECHPDRSR